MVKKTAEDAPPTPDELNELRKDLALKEAEGVPPTLRELFKLRKYPAKYLTLKEIFELRPSLKEEIYDRQSPATQKRLEAGGVELVTAIPERVNAKVDRAIFQSAFDVEFPFMARGYAQDVTGWSPTPPIPIGPRRSGPADPELVERVQEAWRQYCLSHEKPNKTAFANKFVKEAGIPNLTVETVRGILRRYPVK